MKTATWILILGGGMVAAACGQKGPLYLPDKNASVVTRPAGSTNAAPPPATAPDQASPQQTPQATPPKPPQGNTSGASQSSSSSTPKS